MKLILSRLLPKRSGIPVLMYHKIDEASPDSLTVSRREFETQLAWLKSQGYQSISLQSFLDVVHGVKKRHDLPKKPILITFDDGYACTLAKASPILQLHGFQATLFATSSFIEGNTHASGTFMTSQELKHWKDEGHDIALHSHLHPNYRSIQNEEIMHDLKTNQQWFEKHQIPVIQALAYPFGARPKEADRKQDLKLRLKEHGVVAAFRIGNKIATWSSIQKKRYDAFEIPRIDIRGDDTLKSFAVKVQKGRLRPFQ